MHESTPADAALELAAKIRATSRLSPGSDRWERMQAEHQLAEKTLIDMALYLTGVMDARDRLLNKVDALFVTVGTPSRNGSMPWWDELRIHGHPTSRFCFALRELSAELKRQ